MSSISNNTLPSEQRAFEDAGPLIDRIHWIIVFIIMPIVCILGVFGNAMSLIVLYKQGFKKSSNIILFALAASDILFVMGANGPAKVMYEFGRGGFWYPERDAWVLYCFYQLFDYLNWTAGPMSWWLPILITLERFVAVFFPLKFRQIVTTRRTVGAIMIMVVGAYVPQIYVRFWFTFKYEWDPRYNASVGLAARSDLYYRQAEISYTLGMLYSLTGYFVIIIGSGCLAIVIRIGLAAAKRRSMMSGGSGKSNGDGSDGKQQGKWATPSRTTKTLLTLCIFYTISCAFVSLPTFVPHICVWPLFTPVINFRSVEVFMYHLIKLDLCINASVNFVIYMAMNKNFRMGFIEIFKRKKTT